MGSSPSAIAIETYMSAKKILSFERKKNIRRWDICRKLERNIWIEKYRIQQWLLSMIGQRYKRLVGKEIFVCPKGVCMNLFIKLKIEPLIRNQKCEFFWTCNVYQKSSCPQLISNLLLLSCWKYPEDFVVL